MATRKTTADLNDALVRAARAHRTAAGSLLSGLGLHPGQDSLLAALYDEDGRTQADLAQALGVEPPTVTKMLQRMEAAGLVERAGDPNDRRALRVYLTARAKRLRPRLDKALRQLDRQASAGLSARQQSQLVAMLGQIADNLGRA
jgi:DNA-binding MarR family transcriptional regulator